MLKAFKKFETAKALQLLKAFQFWKGLLNFEKAIPSLKIKYFGEKHGPFKIKKSLTSLKSLKF